MPTQPALQRYFGDNEAELRMSQETSQRTTVMHINCPACLRDLHKENVVSTTINTTTTTTTTTITNSNWDY
jgi:hypothetical protein